MLSGSGEEMGAKASQVEASGPISRLENIEAAYEGGDEEGARELIRQACCVECCAGIYTDGVSLRLHCWWDCYSLCIMMSYVG